MRKETNLSTLRVGLLRESLCDPTREARTRPGALPALVQDEADERHDDEEADDDRRYRAATRLRLRIRSPDAPPAPPPTATQSLLACLCWRPRTSTSCLALSATCLDGACTRPLIKRRRGATCPGSHEMRPLCGSNGVCQRPCLPYIRQPRLLDPSSPVCCTRNARTRAATSVVAAAATAIATKIKT